MFMYKGDGDQLINGPTAAVVIFFLLMCVKRLLLSLTPVLRYDTYTQKHTHTYTHTRTCTHMHTHAHTHARTHAHRQTDRQTDRHTHTHGQTHSDRKVSTCLHAINDKSTVSSPLSI